MQIAAQQFTDTGLILILIPTTNPITVVILIFIIIFILISFQIPDSVSFSPWISLCHRLHA